MPDHQHSATPQAESCVATGAPVSQNRRNTAANGSSGQAAEIREQVATLVSERPLTVVMTLFGAGLGVGLLAAQMMSLPESRSRSQQLADRISRAVRDALPGSLR